MKHYLYVGPGKFHGRACSWIGPHGRIRALVRFDDGVTLVVGRSDLVDLRDSRFCGELGSCTVQPKARRGRKPRRHSNGGAVPDLQFGNLAAKQVLRSEFRRKKAFEGHVRDALSMIRMLGLRIAPSGSTVGAYPKQLRRFDFAVLQEAGRRLAILL